MPGRSSFQTLERLLSLLAFETFLFGTATSMTSYIDIDYVFLPWNLLFQKCFQDREPRIALGLTAIAFAFV